MNAHPIRPSALRPRRRRVAVWRELLAAVLAATQLGGLPGAAAAAGGFGGPGSGGLPGNNIAPNGLGKPNVKGLKPPALNLPPPTTIEQLLLRGDSKKWLKEVKVASKARYVCSVRSTQAVFCNSVDELTAGMRPEEKNLTELALNSIYDAFRLDGNQDVLYGCGDGANPFASGDFFTVKSLPGASKGKGGLPGDPLGGRGGGSPSGGPSGFDPRTGRFRTSPFLPGFLGSNQISTMADQCRASLAASLGSAPGAGRGSAGGGGGDYQDTVQATKDHVEDEIDEYCARDDHTGLISQPGSGNGTPSPAPSPGAAGTTPNPQPSPAASPAPGASPAPAPSPAASPGAAQDDSALAAGEKVAAAISGLLTAASAGVDFKEAWAVFTKTISTLGVEEAVAESAGKASHGVLGGILVGLALAANANGDENVAKAASVVGDMFTLLDSLGTAYVEAEAIGTAVGAEGAAAIGVAGSSALTVVGVAVGTGVASYSLTKTAMTASGLYDDWDRYVLTPMADALWESEYGPDATPIKGGRGGKAGGSTQFCPRDADCSNTCEDIQAAWAAFSAHCDESHWQTYDCVKFVSFVNGCADPALINPGPEGDYVCRAPGHPAPAPDSTGCRLLGQPGEPGNIRFCDKPSQKLAKDLERQLREPDCTVDGPGCGFDGNGNF